MTQLIDTHCHLAHGRLARDLPGVLARASAAGVAACICATGNVREAAAAEALARQYEQVYFTAGVHPHEAKSAPPDLAERLAELAAATKNVAIGEIGLDYHYDFSPRDRQREVFAAQLELARTLGKCVVIHTREAFDDTLAILRQSRVDCARAVFHSFTEGPDCARAALDAGAMISFSGIVTFKNSDLLRRSASIAGDDRILVETDAPYLSPEPVRKMKTNEPANVAHVAAALAAIRNVTPTEIAELTTRNARRFFGMQLV